MTVSFILSGSICFLQPMRLQQQCLHKQMQVVYLQVGAFLHLWLHLERLPDYSYSPQFITETNSRSSQALLR